MFGAEYRARPSLAVLRAWVPSAEWWWALTVAAVLTLALDLPFRVAGFGAAYGQTFVGMMWAPQDAAQYFSAMRQGAARNWLIVDRFSVETHAPILMYPLYVLLGKIAAAVGLSMDAAFMLAAALARFAFFTMLYGFVGCISSDVAQRRLMLLVVPSISGVTWAATLAAVALGLEPPAASEYAGPELSTALTLLSAPHLILSLALAFAAATAYVRAWTPASWRPALVAALLIGLLGLTNPFALGPFCAVVAAHAVAMLLLQHARRLAGRAALHGRAVQNHHVILSAAKDLRTDDTRTCSAAPELPGLARPNRPERSTVPLLPGPCAAALMLLVAAPFVAYNALAFSADLFWGGTYGLQNLAISPPPLELLVVLGLALPLAIFGARRFAEDLSPARVLVLVWIPVCLVLMYLPLDVQRRLAFGLHPMLAIVATFALVPLWKALRGRLPVVGLAARPFLTVLLSVALFGSTLTILVGVGQVAAAPFVSDGVPPAADGERTIYQPVALTEAAHWLAANVEPDDVILGEPVTGNYLPAIVPARVFVGHWVATLHFEAKRETARWFYRAPFDAGRLAFLRANGIRYVVYGPHEGQASPSLDDSSGVAAVYANDRVTILRVSP